MTGDENRQAFRKGFLEKLANEGITPERFGSFIKASIDPLSAAVLALAIGGVGGYGLGSLAGRGYASLTMPDTKEYADWVKNQELITAYRQAIQSVNKKPHPPKELPAPPPRKSVTSLFGQ